MTPPRDRATSPAASLSVGGSQRHPAVRRALLLPVLLLIVILGLDAARSALDPGLVLNALGDEVAHVSTALLVLLSLLPRSRLLQRRSWTMAALATAVLIDVDHIPGYVPMLHLELEGRPVSHSVATAVVLLTAGGLPSRARGLLSGAAVGVLLHLVRDVATGPGVVLLWPVVPSEVRLPGSVYAAGMSVACSCAVVRLHREACRDQIGEADIPAGD